MNQLLLGFHGKIAALSREDAFIAFINQLYEKDWIVYCKKPFKSPNHVLEYLGRYTHRVAISNNRLVSRKSYFLPFVKGVQKIESP